MNECTLSNTSVILNSQISVLLSLLDFKTTIAPLEMDGNKIYTRMSSVKQEGERGRGEGCTVFPQGAKPDVVGMYFVKIVDLLGAACRESCSYQKMNYMYGCATFPMFHVTNFIDPI
jgi:hypothetical protein